MADSRSPETDQKDGKCKNEETSTKVSDKMDIQFSHHCGENIELSEEKNRASWTHRFSGGIAFSSQQLQNNKNLKLDLAGTGHAYVGVVTRDPSTIINMRETLARDVLVAKEMKVHKRLGAINITPNIKDGSSCIRFECCGETKILDCSTNSHVWLFVYIKFGDLIAILHSDCAERRCFHNVTGSNIQCLDRERRSVKLHVENPSAICCLNKRIRPGQYVKIQTRAIAENGHAPSRCHIKLGIVDLDPLELKSRDPESFVIDSKTALPTRWTIVQKLSKKNCVGEMKLYLTNTGDLYFSHSSGVEGTHQCRLKDVSSGVSVILDLFRTEVRITDCRDEGTYECVDRDYDYVTSEAEMIENVKRTLKLSDKRREKERRPSNGGYLQMIDVPPNIEHEKANTKGKISPRLTRCGVYKRNDSPTNVQTCK